MRWIRVWALRHSRCVPHSASGHKPVHRPRGHSGAPALDLLTVNDLADRGSGKTPTTSPAVSGLSAAFTRRGRRPGRNRNVVHPTHKRPAHPVA